FCDRCGAQRDPHSFPTRRSSDLLLGAVRADDELLALAPGLLPEAADALEGLGKRKGVLVLPAGPGVAAGFERLDLNRAWAGALRSEEHTSELQSRENLVCRLLLQ